jgi:mannose-6-phosphate isomerase
VLSGLGKEDMLSNIKHLDYCKRIDKPWGYEVIWAESDSGSYVGKLICIYPNKRMSLQYHEKKEETIYVLSGILKIWESESENELTTIGPGSIYHVKPLQVHRFGAGSGTSPSYNRSKYKFFR